jgi:predicted esterase
MRTRALFFILLLALIVGSCNENDEQLITKTDYIQALKDTLLSLGNSSDDGLFKLHCSSFVDLINSPADFTAEDSSLLKATYLAFTDSTDEYSAKKLSTYLGRWRYMIISWVSETDNTTSFAWFKPPKNYDPQLTYPLYVKLRNSLGFIEFLTLPYLSVPGSNQIFEDGFQLTPWGRGMGQLDEADIRESIVVIESLVNINPDRKYISGQSNSGYTAWNIASHSAAIWAGIGMHSGFINNDAYFDSTYMALKDVPIYLVCGDQEQYLLGEYEGMVQKLEAAGNTNVELVTFTGGHEYREEDVLNMYLWLRNFEN